MRVVKRNGLEEEVQFDKITSRIKRLCLCLKVDAYWLAQKVIQEVHDGVCTRDLDVFAAEIAASLVTTHPDWGVLAARITVSNMHKETVKGFSEASERLYAYKSMGCSRPVLSDDYIATVRRHASALNSAIIHDRDFMFTYMGIKTLEKSYLLRLGGKVAERPQHLFMRVAVGIHGDDVDRVLETYKHLSLHLFTHASPTLFNAGTTRPQLSSCFLLQMSDDSIEGIFKTVSDCAVISKSAGGIGINCHNIRAEGTYISGTNGHSNGIVPMLRVFNNVARYVDQGGNKRPGAFAFFMEPWHGDIMEFLDLRKNTGKEENRARDLFYGLWVPDLFMRRVKANATWTLFSPDSAGGLHEVYGTAFDALYERYEADGRGIRTVAAQEVWKAILASQIETGTPYMLYKDACNAKSNQQNLGTIKGSNLCTEIVQYTSAEETAVCNLGSLCLPAFVKKGHFDYDALHGAAKVLARNLDTVIDVTYYPVPEARTSNLRHRPVGMGVQGLADVFMQLKMPFGGEQSRHVNRRIFETIYHAALEASCELAKERGPYASYEGSPMSRGILQFDFWPGTKLFRDDWDTLRANIATYGVRNSLLVAPMPTASTAQIMGNTECFEPCTSNIYQRRVLSGEFQMVNPHLLADLMQLGLWTDTLRQRIIANHGSVSEIKEIPAHLRELYRTVWEISQKDIIDMAADRSPFIDQSHSLNIHLAAPSVASLTSMHFYGWEKGLKTGMYYLRTKPAADAIQFTIDAEKTKAPNDSVCTMEEGCVSCSG